MQRLVLLRGARKIVETCAAVQAGERVVIGTDYGRTRIADAIALAAAARGAEVVTVTMPQLSLDGEVVLRDGDWLLPEASAVWGESV